MKNKILLYFGFAVLLSVFCLTGRNVIADAQLTKTPADYEGPFYPVSRQQDEDNDLIHVQGQTGTAKGHILSLSGVVLNTKGVPQKDITVEIWQADSNGRYNHPDDKSPGERDPNFQYWGRATTGADGSYSFTTVIPKDYEPRPAHIHYKVLLHDKVVLTSQVYFQQLLGKNIKAAMTDKINLQTVNLRRTKQKGEFSAYFRIII